MESAVKIRAKYYGIVMSLHQKCIKSIAYNKKSEIMNLGIQMVERIRELHNLGFLHLDIKPSNVMADKKPKPGKLTYFLTLNNTVKFYSKALSLNNFDL